jgi:hypothetical protein
MKTKILIAVVLMLSVSSQLLKGQTNNEVTNEKSPASHFEIPDDPRLTQADIEMFMEAAKGAPTKAGHVQDDRAISEEKLKAEGVYYLAPVNAEPIDDEAEYQRWLLYHQADIALETQPETISLPNKDRQPVPEFTAPKREISSPAGSHTQPPGEIAPKRTEINPEGVSGGQKEPQSQ